MKIRFQRGSVRFRLKQGEVRSLVETGRVEEPVALGDVVFVQSLELGGDAPTLAFEGSRLAARIPAADARRWASDDSVGLCYEMPEGTRLLVEKDWACLEPADGDANADTFARPSVV